MENIHNTASLAAITAHHESRVSFVRGNAELICEVDPMRGIIYRLLFGDFFLAAGGFVAPSSFDEHPAVQLFNKLPE